jgi:hypothetical protein
LTLVGETSHHGHQCLKCRTVFKKFVLHCRVCEGYMCWPCWAAHRGT